MSRSMHGKKALFLPCVLPENTAERPQPRRLQFRLFAMQPIALWLLVSQGIPSEFAMRFLHICGIV